MPRMFHCSVLNKENCQRSGDGTSFSAVWFRLACRSPCKCPVLSGRQSPGFGCRLPELNIWIKRAPTSLPTPLSPSRSTGRPSGAPCSIETRTLAADGCLLRNATLPGLDREVGAVRRRLFGSTYRQCFGAQRFFLKKTSDFVLARNLRFLLGGAQRLEKALVDRSLRAAAFPEIPDQHRPPEGLYSRSEFK